MDYLSLPLMKRRPKVQQTLMDFKCKLISRYLWLKVLKSRNAKIIHVQKMIIGCLMGGKIS
jgi:hypothetical protein